MNNKKKNQKISLDYKINKYNQLVRFHVWFKNVILNFKFLKKYNYCINDLHFFIFYDNLK